MAGRISVVLALLLVNSMAAAGEPAAHPASQAAVMDLWLATSLGLILLYIRRRLGERRRARVPMRSRRR